LCCRSRPYGSEVSQPAALAGAFTAAVQEAAQLRKELQAKEGALKAREEEVRARQEEVQALKDELKQLQERMLMLEGDEEACR
jgi:hypothetical protein